MINLSVPQGLREYLEASNIALALASPTSDHPLLFINQKFTDLTGYTAADIVGGNCRILQREVEDIAAHTLFQAFLQTENAAPVRAPLVNFTKDGTPFVNLIYMSRLRAPDGETRYILASQFNISRIQPELLEAYDGQLAQTLAGLAPVAQDHEIVVDDTLATIADAVSTIAQAELTLSLLNDPSAFKG